MAKLTDFKYNLKERQLSIDLCIYLAYLNKQDIFHFPIPHPISHPTTQKFRDTSYLWRNWSMWTFDEISGRTSRRSLAQLQIFVTAKELARLKWKLSFSVLSVCCVKGSWRRFNQKQREIQASIIVSQRLVTAGLVIL